jgi:hypothetical protein
MKYLTIILSVIFAFTFMGMNSLNQSGADAQDATKAVETDNKACDKHKCDKEVDKCGKCGNCECKCECKKECKHKCDKDKCKNCGKCDCKCECKKECKRKDEHKCGEGKCGGDTKE